MQNQVCAPSLNYEHTQSWLLSVPALTLQKTNGELLHISLVMLLTSIFYLWFAWDAIVCENAFELIASAVLGAAVCARIIYFVVCLPNTKTVVVHVEEELSVAVLTDCNSLAAWICHAFKHHLLCGMLQNTQCHEA